ncbi:HNH endonuclease signature motif containing protein [Acetobacter malorum]|nr:HNH endonuclease signature motif containing protein [Acetobacter malorum]
MLDTLQQGGRINKAKIRREILDGPLRQRSAGSYEFRMANISTVLASLDMPTLPGYVPRGNVGRKIVQRLTAIINEVWADVNYHLPPDDPVTVSNRVARARREPIAMPPRRPDAPVAAPVMVYRFVRNPYVVAWVLQQSDGNCEACGATAPFLAEDGLPFLEVHHVRPLSEGGPDNVDNAAALCPNCHRRLHHSVDRNDYRQHLLQRVNRLVDYPKDGK